MQAKFTYIFVDDEKLFKAEGYQQGKILLRIFFFFVHKTKYGIFRTHDLFIF